MNRIIRAVRVATHAHRNQKRQVTGQLYIYHPLRVMNDVLLLPDCTEDMACAAVLHDTVEDTDLTLEEIHAEFGGTVATYVGSLTNQFSKKQHPELNRQERKARELERLAAIPREAKLIKLCDRIDNLSDAPFSDDDGLDFREVYVRESRALAKALGSANTSLEARLLALAAKHEER